MDIIAPRKKPKRIGTRLTDKTYKKLKSISKKHGVGISSLSGLIIESFIDKFKIK